MHKLTGIIIAGGRGQRLRPLTDDKPKPMIPIKGIPILGRQLLWLKAQGVETAIIACGYRHEVIQECFLDGKEWGIKIEYSIEERPLGRGGAIKKALKYSENYYVVVLNGDIITDLSLAPVLEAHVRSQAPATLVVTPLVSPYGIVENFEGKATGFLEKPSLPYWINAGIYIFNSPEMKLLLPDTGDQEDTTFPEMAKEGQLMVYQSKAYWRSLDNMKDLEELEKEAEQL